MMATAVLVAETFGKLFYPPTRYNSPESGLKKLLQICNDNKLESFKAYTAFELYLELSEVRNLLDLECLYHEKLQLFYLCGKKEESDQHLNVYVPVIFESNITATEINLIQENLNPKENQFYVVIRDRDSSSTCYAISKGLSNPLSASLKQQAKKSHPGKSPQILKKMYSKALKSSF